VQSLAPAPRGWARAAERAGTAGPVIALSSNGLDDKDKPARPTH
jgi:hypothetical protein